MEVFVHIKGHLRAPVDGLTFRSHKFTVRQEDPEIIAKFINDAMMEILNLMRGMICVKDEKKTTKGIEGFNNLQFFHIDLFSHFDIETRILGAVKTPNPDEKGFIN